MAERTFVAGEWAERVLAALKLRTPATVEKKRPHFDINLGLPAWKSTVEMDGKRLESVTEVSVLATVSGLTEIRLTMFGTARIIGEDGVEVEKVVACPRCGAAHGDAATHASSVWSETPRD